MDPCEGAGSGFSEAWADCDSPGAGDALFDDAGIFELEADEQALNNTETSDR